MKERPILFSGPMVRALLSGSKTQTRRIVKPQPIYGDVGGAFASWMFKKRHANGHWLYPNARSIVLSECPYGQSGDSFWVRESLAPTRNSQGYIEDWHYAADGAKVPRMPDLNPMFSDAMAFSHLARMSVPSIHMPRWASRITLEVTGVRVERLQDISEADAESEGIDFLRHVPDADETLTPSQLFMCLWDGLKPVAGAAWADNPWVWAVEFKRSAA